MWRELFYLSKADRRALAFLLSVLLIFTAIKVLLPRHDKVLADDVLASIDTLGLWQDTVIDVSEPYSGEHMQTAEPVRSQVRSDGSERYRDIEVTAGKPLYQKQEKYPYGTVIDLNGADTLELRKIPGIGKYYSKRIFEYGQALGGYAATAQLGEIEGLPDSVRNWFLVADTFQVRKIMVNEASLSELRAHPYMGFYKARAIVEYRKRNGKIKNPAQLSLFEEFSGQDIVRLSPYLCFD